MRKMQQTNLLFDGVLQTRAESVLKELRASFCRMASKKCVLYLRIPSGEHGDHSLFSQHSVFFKNTVIRQDAIFFSGASENKNGVWVF